MRGPGPAARALAQPAAAQALRRMPACQSLIALPTPPRVAAAQLPCRRRGGRRVASHVHVPGPQQLGAERHAAGGDAGRAVAHAQADGRGDDAEPARVLLSQRHQQPYLLQLSDAEHRHQGGARVRAGAAAPVRCCAPRPVLCAALAPDRPPPHRRWPCAPPGAARTWTRCSARSTASWRWRRRSTCRRRAARSPSSGRTNSAAPTRTARPTTPPPRTSATRTGTRSMSWCDCSPRGVARKRRARSIGPG
jgi:hypothetical protein